MLIIVTFIIRINLIVWKEKSFLILMVWKEKSFLIFIKILDNVWMDMILWRILLRDNKIWYSYLLGQNLHKRFIDFLMHSQIKLGVEIKIDFQQRKFSSEIFFAKLFSVSLFQIQSSIILLICEFSELPIIISKKNKLIGHA